MARRSVLVTPGDRPEMLRKAAETGADVIVFDLEDAVTPARKPEAREAVRAVLTDPDFDPECEVCVRVNATPGAITSDLDAVFGSADVRLDSIMRPKVAAASDVHTLVDELDRHDASCPVFALIESARGVLAAAEIAAVPSTDALVFGAEDFAADVGATRTDDGTELSYARQRVVVAAAAHDCDAIDTLVTDFEDERRLRADTERSIQLGYDGKLAIHPTQVGPINEVYTPDEDEIEWAESVLEARRKAHTEDRGVFEVDGEMIDAPLIAQAERLRERAREADRSQ